MSHIDKTNSRLVSYLALVTIAVFGIISTLGTGGGDGDSGGVSPVTYTGLETPAVVTSDNAKSLAEVAFLGVTAGAALPIAIEQKSTQYDTRGASIVTIARVMHTALRNINVNSDLSAAPTGWVETQPTIEGECGGTLGGSLEVNESNQTFSGSLIFNNYCEFGITMNGTVAMSGTCDAATFDPVFQICDIIDLTLTFTTFVTSGDGISETMSGNFAITFSTTGYETIMNLLLRVDSENLTFKFENYIVTVTENSPPGYDSVVVSGNVYHPDYGFVVVSTPAPVQFYIDALGSPPLTGVAVLTGAAGTVGPTTATITFIDGNSYQIAVDTDGNGSPDFTWSCTWEPDSCVVV